MTALRGKPVLYGWVCETFPECNLDLDKFNELKNSGKIQMINKINNYYINKQIRAEGNQEKDGEKNCRFIIVNNLDNTKEIKFVICENCKKLLQFAKKVI